MFTWNETAEVDETPEATDETTDMDPEFETELDDKYHAYSNGERSLEDIQNEKEELMRMREELIKYKEAQESDSSETDDDDDPEKVLALRRHR